MNYRLLLGLAGISFILASCSVKEDRGPCPCRLDIDVSDCVRYTDKLAVSGWGAGKDRLFHDRISLSDFPDVYSKKIDKGELIICAWSGVKDMSFKNDVLIIPEGCQCDSIRAYRGEVVDAWGETAEDEVFLHKQFATIHFQMDSLSLEAGEVLLRVVGNVNGMELPSLLPRKGAFRCFAAPRGCEMQSANVPRQADDSLVLEIYLDGILFQELKIGEMISEAGYSWEREDLEDIYLSIGLFSSMTLTVSISGWDTERTVRMI